MHLLPSLSFSRPLTTALIAAVFSSGLIAAHAASTPGLLDDFSDPSRNTKGNERLLIEDKNLGSHSHATQKCQDGILTVEGELVPGRGVPAFISLVSPLFSDGKPQDLTGWEGIRLRIKVIKGILSVQVGSAEINNFDYHTSPPLSGKRAEFVEARLPFNEMKRAWSEQTVLNLKTITSINLVSFGMAKDTFAYEVDEIGFY